MRQTSKQRAGAGRTAIDDCGRPASRDWRTRPSWRRTRRLPEWPSDVQEDGVHIAPLAGAPVQGLQQLLHLARAATRRL